jgi:thiol-disulfide isomerase/thioredoxin
MLKNLSFLLIAAVILASCTGKKAKNEFAITGTVDTVVSSKIYLQKRADGPLITLDSSIVSSSGEFKFKGVINYPEVYYLTMPATKSSVPFFIEPSDIIVNIRTKDINKTKITGSKNQAAYEVYLDKVDEYNNKINDNYDKFTKCEQNADLAGQRYYDSLMTVLDDEKTQYSKDYVLQNPGLFVSPYIMFRNSYAYSLEELEKSLSTFDTSLSHSVYTGFLNNYMNVLRRVSVGKPYVPFSMADTAGVETAISDYVGKGYLLVDMWASWCAPCRAENPNIARLYRKYHDRGFDIFAISFDSNHDRWLKAIKSDSLTWHHVSDLKGWDNAAGKLYGIRSIPSNLLLDSTGTIIAKNILGEELRMKLEELYPAPVKPAKKR